MRKTLVSLLVLVVFVGSCGSDNTVTPTGKITSGNDPNFKIVANTDGILSGFTRKVEVFGISIYAVPRVTDAKLLHAANIMAQYLDNDENGEVDDKKVLDAMIKAKAFMVMWKQQSDLGGNMPSGRTGQDLGNDETHPEWHAGKTGAFDASLEEVWHIITHAGYANAYPKVFGEAAGTTLANAMDKARGGRFTTIPKKYPSGAWYTYNDKTCNYNCMATEYFYWAMTSVLGAQTNRLNEIGHEWKLNTRAKVQSGDPDVFALLTGGEYKLPTKLPDGTYKR